LEITQFFEVELSLKDKSIADLEKAVEEYKKLHTKDQLIIDFRDSTIASLNRNLRIEQNSAEYSNMRTMISTELDECEKISQTNANNLHTENEESKFMNQQIEYLTKELEIAKHK
jgi:hypothetical protein